MFSFPNKSTQNAYNWKKSRLDELKQQAKDNGNKIERHNKWRMSYYENPYLILENNDAILDRFSEIISNTMEINADGKIALIAFERGGDMWMSLFTEIIEETNWRGILNRDNTTGRARGPADYFNDGPPIGVKMFEGKTDLNREWLIKFSDKVFVDEMFRFGRFKISPASFYAKGSHIRAVKDLETTRHYKIKALKELLSGKTEVEILGRSVPIVNGTVPLDYQIKDYYLFSTCCGISRRMPTDFESDSALIIKNKNEFILRIKKALQKKFIDWNFIERKVYYYDPYNDLPHDKNQEFWKHMAYAYQKEHRCILKPPLSVGTFSKLEPFFIEIGSLSDIAEVVK
jgi:hypothetical protein